MQCTTQPNNQLQEKEITVQVKDLVRLFNKYHHMWYNPLNEQFRVVHFLNALEGVSKDAY